MIQKILTHELIPGMRVAKPKSSGLSNPFLYANEGVVATREEIDQILATGFIEVYIEISSDPRRTGKRVPEINKEELPETKISRFDKASPSVPLEIEMPLARALYDDSVRFARKTLLQIQNGESLPLDEGCKIVDGILESIAKNYNALLGLIKLRRRDEYTYTHCVNVCMLSSLLSVQMGLDEETIKRVGLAGLFHDIGKAHIPHHILNKAGKLTDAEFEVIKRHPNLGFDHVRSLELPEEVFSGIRDHHEQLNGKGYPSGLKSSDISQTARIISIVDVYDAMTSQRIYRKPMIPHQALSRMYSLRKTKFDENMLEQFICSQGIYPVGSVVELSSGWRGVVVQVNPESPLRPKVVLVQNLRGRSMYGGETIDLFKQTKLTITRVMTPTESGVDPSVAIPGARNI